MNAYGFFLLQTHGTVSPLKSFDPYRDVHDLRIAMQHYRKSLLSKKEMRKRENDVCGLDFGSFQ